MRAISRLGGPLDIARVAAVSLLFHASLAVESIRLWAQERGFELPASLLFLDTSLASRPSRCSFTPCRLEAGTASPSPLTAPSGAGAMETMASWATATIGTCCCQRRSKPLASASSLVGP